MALEMQIVRSVEALRIARKALAGRVGFVPTMGFLHEGHLSLMRQARRDADHVVVSIYVNPTQFGPNEDLDAYPRDMEGDLAKCRAEGVSLVFIPDNALMYPNGYRSKVSVAGLSDGLCGAGRPGHFDGVTTIVSKFFNLVQPDLAVFGQKDYQQLAVIRAMVKDLNMPIEIVGAPIVREPDGLAMSSRHAYLDGEQRLHARVLKRSLDLARRLITDGARETGQIRQAMCQMFEAEPGVEWEYVDLVEPDSLRPLEQIDKAVVIAVACRVGSTRLIDNTRVDLGPR